MKVESSVAIVRERRRLIVGTAALVLAALALVLAGLRWFAREEERRMELLQDAVRENSESVGRMVRESEEAVRKVQARAEAEIKSVDRRRQRALMDEDARQLAGAAQQYFMESANAVVAVNYDPRTGALGGPVATYLPRIAPGYAAVPAQLALTGSFSLDHPNVGSVRRYHEDGRPVADGPE